VRGARSRGMLPAAAAFRHCANRQAATDPTMRATNALRLSLLALAAVALAWGVYAVTL